MSAIGYGTRLHRVVLATSLILGSATATQASGFIYAAVPALACGTSQTCAPPQLVVLDADTGAVAVRLPLPVRTKPAGLAISPDGRHLYVSNLQNEAGGVTSITVIDALRHTVIGTFETNPNPAGRVLAGRLAVRADDSRVFIVLSGGTADRIGLFDTATHATTVPAIALTFTGLSGAPLVVIAADPSLDRLYASATTCNSFFCPGGVDAIDAATLANVGHVDVNFGVSGMSISADGKRLHVGTFGATSPTRPPLRMVLDPSTLVTAFSEVSGLAFGTPVDVAKTSEVLMFGSDGRTLYRLGAGRDPITLPATSNNHRVAVAAGGNVAFASMTTAVSGTVVGIDLASNTILETVATVFEPTEIVSSPDGVPVCRYGLETGFAAFASGGGTSSIRLATDCAWEAAAVDTWVHLSATSGLGSTTISVTADPHILPTPRTATLTIAGKTVTVTQAGDISQPPFGAFDTPVDGAGGISGSLPVTGWALDDVGVKRVLIARDRLAEECCAGSPPLFVGEASLVEGSRPDVQAAFPGVPFNTRAGWGYLLLTNFLPRGNGTFRLHAFAEDVDGHTTLLGSKTITVSNTTATLPFGAIDTPAQGGLVSGTIVNFGWALTPPPANIPIDGSTIDVVIDGRVVGHPTYNQPRIDIQTLFPGYANTNGAIGFFTIDTTALANGVHTIAWVVRDSLGRGAGIGSRFFTVFNTSSLAGDPLAAAGASRDVPAAPTVREAAADSAPEPSAELRVATTVESPQVERPSSAGLAIPPPLRARAMIAATEPGPTVIRIGELLDVDVAGPSSDVCVPVYGASLISGAVRGAPLRSADAIALLGSSLPGGAGIDRDGHFHWTPRDGQTGTYHFVLVRSLCETVAERRTIHVTVVGR